MKVRHDNYPLQPDCQFEARYGIDNRLVVDAPASECPVGDSSWLLAVDYRATSRIFEPSIAAYQGNTWLFTQYLECGQQGRRWVNLTGITSLENIVLVTQHCRLAEKMQLHGFTKPALGRGPVLVVAPHPDDAELAAYGLYQRLAEQTWIVTLSAGERQKDLTKQYLPGLDGDRGAATRRKGWVRAWNSATTPMLAGVLPERLVMLGYFNDTLFDLLEEPAQEICPAGFNDQAGGVASFAPCDFRRWNRLILPSDAGSSNRGDCLIEDLTHLFELIRPETLVVTHPEIDPHRDHIAAARACSLAMSQAQHIPEQVLFYANHLRGVRKFPYGPPHAAATLWPNAETHTRLGPWRFYSEVLSKEVQRQKVIAMDSMHDLRARSRFEKRFKQWIKQKMSGVKAANYADHEYFMTHIKAHENFAVVSGSSFQNFF